MIRRTSITRLFAATLLLGLATTTAEAGLLPVSVSIQPEAGNFRWTYSVQLPTDLKLQTGSYFTIYDFGGYVNGSGRLLSPYPDDTYAGYWTFSTSKTGPTPNRLNPQDDPNTDNLTWTYNGPTINGIAKSLGNFVASSQYKDVQNSFFTGTNFQSDGKTVDSNITETISPVGSTPNPTPGVPEPTTLALAGLGLPLIGAARWYRRKKAAA